MLSNDKNRTHIGIIPITRSSLLSGQINNIFSLKPSANDDNQAGHYRRRRVVSNKPGGN